MLQTQMMSRLSWQQNEDKFGNLNLLPSTKKRTENSFELFLFIYGYYMFFLKNRTSVLANNRFAKYVRAFKEICFSKNDNDHAIFRPPPPKKKLAAQQHRAIFRQEKMVFPLPPPSGCLGSPLPPNSVRTAVRAYAEATTKISHIGHQICLPILLRSAAFGRTGTPLLTKLLYISENVVT